MLQVSFLLAYLFMRAWEFIRDLVPLRLSVYASEIDVALELILILSIMERTSESKKA